MIEVNAYGMVVVSDERRCSVSDVFDGEQGTLHNIESERGWDLRVVRRLKLTSVESLINCDKQQLWEVLMMTMTR